MSMCRYSLMIKHMVNALTGKDPIYVDSIYELHIEDLLRKAKAPEQLALIKELGWEAGIFPLSGPGEDRRSRRWIASERLDGSAARPTSMTKSVEGKIVIKEYYSTILVEGLR